MAKDKLKVEDPVIRITTVDLEEYICITDMVKNQDRPAIIVLNWFRNRSTLLFLAAWERMYNTDFNVIEFDDIMQVAG